jgi:hypothetical protein
MMSIPASYWFAMLVAVVLAGALTYLMHWLDEN